MIFSVVIPLYNKERHIQRAINSVLKQTYHEFELIVVNDGSTDSSVHMVRQIQDPRIKLLCQQNAGVSAARNRGINEARGELIAFLDADDAWRPNFLDTIMRLRKNYPNSGAYSTSFECQNSEGKIAKKRNKGTLTIGWEGVFDDYFQYAIKNKLFCSSSVAIPRSVFEDVGLFDTSLIWGEDLNMWCRVALKYKVAFSNTICAIYFQDADNRACIRHMDYRRSFVNGSEKFLEENKRAFSNSIYFEEYMIRRIIKKAKYLICDNKQKQARRLLLKYKNTKLNKIAMLITLMVSFLPSWFVKNICDF